MLDLNIKCGNSLITDKFNWEKEFEPGTFDCVVGNPPYLSSINHNKYSPEDREFLKKSKDYKCLKGKWDLYIAFMEKGLKLIKQNGYYGVIIPSAILEQGYAQELRKYITENYNIESILDGTQIKVFKNANVKTVAPIVSKKEKTENIDTYVVDKNRNINYSHSRTNEEFIINKNTCTWNIEPLNELEQIKINVENTNKIGEIIYITTGIRPYSKETGKFKKDDIVSDNKNNINTHEYIEAKDIEQYNINNIRYIEWNTKRVPSELASATFPELHSNKKLAINRLGIIKATYDDKQILCDQSLMPSVLWKDIKEINNQGIRTTTNRIGNRKTLEKISENYNLKYLLAILNTKLGTHLLNTIRGFNDHHIQPKAIQEIPIAKADMETQNKIAEQVDIMMDKNASNNAKANAEATINKTIYEIYQLTEEEIAIIEGEYDD